MLSRALESTDVLRRVEIALDQLDQAVDVFGGDCVVLLVEVVDVAVENFDEQLDAHSSVHTSVSNAQGTLQALKYALAVAVRLFFCQ